MKMLIIIIPLILKTTQALPEIGVECGQLMMEGYNSYEFNQYQGALNCKGLATLVLPGPFFGLNDRNECNFGCSEEVLRVNSCRTDSAQIWTGVILDGILFILICGFLWKCCYSTTNLNSWLNRGDESENSLKEDLIIAVDTDDQITLKENPELNKAVKNRTSQAGSKTLAAVIVSLLFFKSAGACDVTVIMSDGNGVTAFCKGSDCGAQPGSFTVRQGHEISIEDRSGERVSLQISNVVWRFRYELAYYTTDYADSVTYASYCCGDNKDLCHEIDCKNLNFFSYRLRVAPSKTAEYTCLRSMSRSWISCDYLVEREKRGGIYSVFKFKPNSMSVEAIKVTVKKGYDSQEITMRGSNLTHVLDLTKFALENVKTIPITVINGKTKLDSFRSALLQAGDKFYYVNSSAEVNSPKYNVFGDFQIHLNKLDENYAPIDPLVTCGYKDGHCECSTPTTSMISKFLRQKENFRQAKNITVIGDSSVTIDSFDMLDNDQWELTMRLGSWAESNFKLMPGRCDVSVLENYGCSSCNESGYVVLGAHNIQKTGLMPFYSNCSLDRYSINCDSEPTALILKSKSGACYIKLLNLNKSFVVNAKYFNFGHQVQHDHGINNTKDASYVVVSVHFVTGAQLIEAFVGIMFIFCSFCFLAKIICRTKRTQQLTVVV